ncbi:MAG: UDP-N-acetylmuramoyl-tripeptide--D-alanyl-D-alanine ligase [Actinobacteria bacterium]|nr:UDP-N-acetylmuramoyl-tripeptide--D-alanyl-D-alanine ligase [Actinomycetota bacterium]
MIPLPLDEVSRLCAGRLHRTAWADEITGVQIDSRRIAEGDLFVAIGAGSDFVPHALARGAAAALVPEQPFASMAALGRAVRERSAAKVVGITGSTGKTSTKDILAALCRPHTRMIAAEASYNAELGVPLTLCRLEPGTELCILELAMRGFGQIAELCAIARPEVGVITAIGPVHLEFVGSIQGVARAKAELVDALPPGGTIVVPSDAEELDRFLERSDIDVVRVGPGGDVSAGQVDLFDDHAQVEVERAGEYFSLRLAVNSYHQVSNALFALAAYCAVGLPLVDVGRGAGEIALARWRGEELPLPGGGTLINDAYNANPASMRAALEHLVQRAGTSRRVAVLGDMAELGDAAPRYHREIGEIAAELGIDVIVAVGGLARGYVEEGRPIPFAVQVASASEAVGALERLLEPGDWVLVKASRAVALEAVADALTGVRAHAPAAATLRAGHSNSESTI